MSGFSTEINTGCNGSPNVNTDNQILPVSCICFSSSGDNSTHILIWPVSGFPTRSAGNGMYSGWPTPYMTFAPSKFNGFIFLFQLFNNQQVCPVNPHILSVAIFPTVVLLKRKDVDVSRVVRHFGMCAPRQDVRHIRGRILMQRAHRFRTDVRVMVPTPTIKPFVFRRGMACSEQFPLD